MNNCGVGVIVLIALLFVMPSLVDAQTICKHVVLYPLTFPVGKGEHTILCHPVGKLLQQQNNQNILFDKGIVSAQQHSTLTKCPSNDKNFCTGWKTIWPVAHIVSKALADLLSEAVFLRLDN